MDGFRMNANALFRKAHRWGAILVAGPFLLVVVTGLLLQVKKQVGWVQPPTRKGAGKEPAIGFDAILNAVKSVPEMEVTGWSEISRIDVQPSKGIAKVTSKNHWETQIDLKSGAVLQSAYRRSDLIESLHDGSWFHDNAKLFIFLPSGVIVLGLWLTGMYLFALPWWVKWRRRRAVPR
jgi:uncharacterized iron-regulated membrane protein